MKKVPPSTYPNSHDYRWRIVTDPGMKVQLLFAFFKTQEEFDFVFVSILSKCFYREFLFITKQGSAIC